MKIAFTVVGVTAQPIGQSVIHEGKTVRAAVESMTYELVADNPRFGSITWRLVGDEIAELSPKLQRDAKVTWEI